MLTYFAIIGRCREALVEYANESLGEAAAEFLRLAMILPSLGFLLVPLVWAARESKRYALVCPECTADLSRSARRVRATRCCGFCKQQIVEGQRIHGGKAFERLVRIEQRRFFIFWFWTWPILSMLILSYHWIDAAAFSNCPHMLFIPGLIGTTASGWAFMRTRDRRYLPQLVASATVFCMGLIEFW